MSIAIRRTRAKGPVGSRSHVPKEAALRRPAPPHGVARDILHGSGRRAAFLGAGGSRASPFLDSSTFMKMIGHGAVSEVCCRLCPMENPALDVPRPARINRGRSANNPWGEKRRDDIFAQLEAVPNMHFRLLTLGATETGPLRCCGHLHRSDLRLLRIGRSTPPCDRATIHRTNQRLPTTPDEDPRALARRPSGQPKRYPTRITVCQWTNPHRGWVAGNERGVPRLLH